MTHSTLLTWVVLAIILVLLVQKHSKIVKKKFCTSSYFLAIPNFFLLFPNDTYYKGTLNRSCGGAWKGLNFPKQP